ncbi:MAG: hypothetical protein J0L92_16695 [Deltaproteobacteria bacterium]|nr:hypothetical protein [Deltaproteobacteria bacterium]
MSSQAPRHTPVIAELSGRVMVQSMRGRFELADVRPSFDLFLKLARDRPTEKLGTLSFTKDARMPPSPDVATTIAKWKAEVAPFATATAYLIEGEGFGASFARLALGSVLLVNRGHARESTFSRVEDAIAWLAGHLDLTPDEVRRLGLDLARIRRGHDGLDATRFA